MHCSHSESVETLCSESKDVFLLKRIGEYNVHSLKCLLVENYKTSFNADIIEISQWCVWSTCYSWCLILISRTGHEVKGNNTHEIILVFLKQHKIFSDKSCKSTTTCTENALESELKSAQFRINVMAVHFQKANISLVFISNFINSVEILTKHIWMTQPLCYFIIISHYT